MNKQTQPIQVKQNEFNPVPVEVLAQSIADIAAAMQQIERSRLSRRALVALIHDQSKIAKRDIEIVLNNLGRLEMDWLKKQA